jgi:hypothetical protein
LFQQDTTDGSFCTESWFRDMATAAKDMYPSPKQKFGGYLSAFLAAARLHLVALAAARLHLVAQDSNLPREQHGGFSAQHRATASPEYCDPDRGHERLGHAQLFILMPPLLICANHRNFWGDFKQTLRKEIFDFTFFIQPLQHALIVS